MKTNQNLLFILIKRYLIISKIVLLFIFFTIPHAIANVYSQNDMLTINKQNITIRQLFREIESKSDVAFLYNDRFNDLDLLITAQYQNANLKDLLDDVLKNTSLNFKVIDNNMVVLVPKSPVAEKRITGTIKDESGQTLPGVNVLEVGTLNGVVTDINGNYSITLNSPNALLRFSFIGYLSEEIRVGEQTVINVSLIPDITQLDEFVVVGFGERRRRDLTGSISTVGSDVLERLPNASPQFALQGNTTGVRIVNTSGDPNAAPSIFIRGIGSWQGTAQPLYVIDGQIITPPSDGNFDVLAGANRDTPPNLWTLINPNDIESISVLKDASAAAIYGSRGANGVILITTKRGRKGEPTLEFNSYTGVQNIPYHNMLNTQEYYDIVHEMFANNLNPGHRIERELYGRQERNPITRRVAFSPQFDPTSPFYIESRETYDWQRGLTRENALDQAYDLKISGASDNVRYYLSAGYKDQEGTFVGNHLKRYTAAVNVDTDMKKWLNTGVNYRFAYQDVGADDRTDLVGLAEVAPWQPLNDENSPTGFAAVLDTDLANWNQARIYGQGSRDNYLALTNLQSRSFNLQRHIAQGFAELKPLDGLTIRGSLNVDFSTQDRRLLDIYAYNIFRTQGGDPATAAPNAPDSKGRLTSRMNYITNFQADLMASYDKTIDNHRITLTAVVQDQSHRRTIKDITGSNLLSVTDMNRLGFGNDLDNNNSFYGLSDEKYWFGYVGRINYIYNQKYYLDLSYRRDGSSGFAEEYRWGNFYSVSGAWRISSERFMREVSFINDLKLRGGYGEAGNDEVVVGSYAYLSTVGGSGSYRWGSGNGDPIGILNPAINVADFPNPALTWETVGTKYIGLDALLFASRVNLTVELYNRRTDGIQQFVNLPLSVGTNNPAFNIGIVDNKGLDLLAGYNEMIGDFMFGVSGNISFIRNEVVKLYNNQPLFTNFGRVEVGRSIGHIWGYQVGGMFQSQEEIDAYYANITDQTISNVNYVAPGDLWFKDVGGNPTAEEPFYSTTPDGLINSYDQTQIGNTIPGHTYGINLNAAWKGLDFVIGFYGEGNVDKYNYVKARLESMAGAELNYSASTLNRYTPENTNTSIPRAVYNDPAGNNRFSDRFVESAAFFRLNNWQLGYTLPQSILARTNDNVKSLRVFIGGQNNFYAFRWSGIDPVNDRKPLAKSYSMGLNVKF